MNNFDNLRRRFLVALWCCLGSGAALATGVWLSDTNGLFWAFVTVAVLALVVAMVVLPTGTTIERARDAELAALHYRQHNPPGGN